MAEEVVAGEAVVVEEEEEEEVGEEVDGTKEDIVDMEATEDMVDTEERKDGTSISFCGYSEWSRCSVSHELSSVFSMEGETLLSDGIFLT